MHHPGQRGAGAPQDQADKNEFAYAAAFGVNRAGDLKEEVAEEEQRPQQGGDTFGDPQIFSNTGRRSEAEVSAVEICQAIRDKHDRHDVPPAFCCIRRTIHRFASVSEVTLIIEKIRYAALHVGYRTA